MAKRIFQLLLTICLCSSTLWAVNDPFAGKWKLNPSRSKLTDQMKVKVVGPNKYELNFSGDNVETIVADGTDQPALFDTTLSITVDGPDHWKVVRKTNGHTTIIGIWELSDGGNTLTDSFTGYHANGSVTNLHYVYKRTAGTSGFPGTWESTTEQVNSTFEIQIQPYQDAGLSFIYPATEMTKSLNFDGKEYRNSGPNIPQGYTSSAHRLNERTLQITDKINAKLINTQQIELSPDHKTLTITVSTPGQSKPNIQVFDRE